MTSLADASLPLSGLLNIQKNYLNDLAEISQTNRNVAGDLDDIQQRLKTIDSSFKDANTSAEYTLTHQSKIEDILEKEHQRLLSKKDEIDNIHFGKMRSVELNDSYRKRQSEYIRIIVAIIIAIVLYIAVSLILPDQLRDISVVIIFVALIIYCGKILWVVYKRDNMNHDRLDLLPPSDVNSGTRGSLPLSRPESTSSSSAVCVGEVCCAEGSRWDASVNKCIISCTDSTKPISKGNECISMTACVAPFKICGNACISETATCGTTTVNPFSTLGEERIQTKTSEVKPYTPYEYNEYAPVM
jgi:hypothetical protein